MAFRHLKVPRPILCSAPCFRSPPSFGMTNILFHRIHIDRHGMNWVRRTFGLKQYSYPEMLRRDILILEALSRDPLYKRGFSPSLRQRINVVSLSVVTDMR